MKESSILVNCDQCGKLCYLPDMVVSTNMFSLYMKDTNVYIQSRHCIIIIIKLCINFRLNTPW